MICPVCNGTKTRLAVDAYLPDGSPVNPRDAICIACAGEGEVPDMNKPCVSDDGYLLRKVVGATAIRRVLDVQAMNITADDLRAHMMMSDTERRTKATQRLQNDQPGLDRFYVMEMSSTYAPPDDRDLFVWYNDVGPLSGSAGYLRIRDGYVLAHSTLLRT